MGDNNSVNWATVGAAWALCTLTTLVILLGLFGARVFKRVGKKRLRDPLRDGSTVAESQIVVRGEKNRASSASRQALLNTSRQNSTTDTGQAMAMVCSRRSSDFISQWCTEHGLSEHTAIVLRGEGFLTRPTVDSLTPDIIPSLGLRNKGQECLLRKIIAQLNPSTDVVPPSASGPVRLASVLERPRSYHLSSSEEAIPGSAEPLKSPAAAPLLEKSRSAERLDESSQLVIGCPLRKKSSPSDVTKTNAGVFVFEDSLRGQVGRNPKGFNGLLSDKGLYDIAQMVGHEWLHLATMLEIPRPVQEKIRMDYSSSTEQQIVAMLRRWRDTAGGSKEEIKGTLHMALMKVKRKDIADELMKEQVHGSQEGFAYSSII
ncbi:hypothetical protein NP493_63g01025 [Ridgeia piscesae]|uniref:Death domain-containing protein n=1 Tax=Ridgeia piscesae TaxID=27915 RepID=A0AAD9PA14_RIDPI|nr:hypothetical protein NP493_63g01025 [Ridgeia piscesae]